MSGLQRGRDAAGRPPRTVLYHPNARRDSQLITAHLSRTWTPLKHVTLRARFPRPVAPDMATLPPKSMPAEISAQFSATALSRTSKSVTARSP
jgi:hypothetical protein